MDRPPRSACALAHTLRTACAHRGSRRSPAALRLSLGGVALRLALGCPLAALRACCVRAPVSLRARAGAVREDAL